MTGSTALILASASPRRREALAALGVRHAVAVSHAEETLGAEVDPSDPVPPAVAKAIDVSAQHPGATVLAGDTIVTVDGTALGKPGTPAAAVAMLRTLRGRRHTVRTAVALVAAAGTAASEVAAPLTMRDYSDDEIEAYVATGEPLDCAGAYDVHREGSRLIAEVEGCFSAIVGLPLVEAVRLLRRAGIAVVKDPAAVCGALYGRPCLAAAPDTAERCRGALRRWPGGGVE